MSFRSWIKTEGREALIDAAMEITREIRDEILASSGWLLSPEVREAEKEVDRAFTELLEGRGSIEDYRKACEQWKLSGLADQEKTRA